MPRPLTSCVAPARDDPWDIWMTVEVYNDGGMYGSSWKMVDDSRRPWKHRRCGRWMQEIDWMAFWGVNFSKLTSQGAVGKTFQISIDKNGNPSFLLSYHLFLCLFCFSGWWMRVLFSIFHQLPQKGPILAAQLKRSGDIKQISCFEAMPHVCFCSVSDNHGGSYTRTGLCLNSALLEVSFRGII